MPKDTYFKLSEEKRRRILEAATEEFLEYKDNYDKASVKRIAKKADIAIGSIYKYFEDKNDLFCCVFDYHKPHPEVDVPMSTLYDYSRATESADSAQNHTSDLLMEIVLDNRELFRYLIFDTTLNSDYFKNICDQLEKDKKNGLLRDDADIELAAYTHTSIEYIVHNYCTSKQLDFKENFNHIFKEISEMLFFGIYRDGVKEHLENRETKK